MRYTQDTSRLKFRTKQWQSLWESNVSNLAALKDVFQSSASTFVAIDTEGYHSKGDIGVTEIGIAVLPHRDQVPAGNATKNLETFFDKSSIQSHSFRIQGRERREKGRDAYQFGESRHIEPREIEPVLVSLFASLKDQFQHLVLVGFDLSSEFMFLASDLHTITPFVSSWVDLQELVADISGSKTSKPSMRYPLLALGFPSGGLSVPNKSQHSAGNDAVRELAILVKLLGLPESSIPPQIHKTSSQASRSRPLRMFWDSCRPRPKELYPFIATVHLTGGKLTCIIKNLEGLQRIFAKYEPTAVGMVKNGNYGWVCLPSADRLAQFFEEIESLEVEGMAWNVTTDYDHDAGLEGSPVGAMTLAQLRAAKAAEQKAEMDNK
ncbi:hypothetical protein B0H67DRAFT_675898 [Lasiosphaeris hirsuta]|uniref:Gfd2/YDR514C-like C-terminal domain-containing protein n=1 Tax=Lasiosphaeris hirsuta TaxID=260670 RepID=A0AA39ZSM1_9PEZI|nr:hypothetical protein B0H67DRAFT_675898 [Lasiosphaeris hirsuta]